MVLTVEDLYGEPESAADVRSRAWEAMCKWITFRCSRKRGVNVPNVFQLYWQVTGADGGSKVRRPVFVLSDRFAENYGVETVQPPPPGTPAAVAGDDLNFYELAITHSRNLTKDEVFGSLREMLFKVGEAASQGRELRINFGAGHLTASDRRVGFDFSAQMGGGSGGGGGALGGAHKGEVSADPMLNANAVAPSLLLAGVAAAAGSVPPEPVGGGRSALGGATELSAEEESRLFAEVDQLDPEERAFAAGASATELEAGTRQQIGRVLAVADEQLRAQTMEDVGAALGARAAELEAQLIASQRETAQVEARLNKLTPRQPQQPPPPPPKRPLSLPARGGPAPAAAVAADGLGGAVMGLQGASLQHGFGASQKGSRVGGSKPSSRVGAAPKPAAAAGPALSIGFGAEGSAQVALPPPEPAQHFGRNPPPVRVARSATSSAANAAAAAKQARQAASQKVAVAPPLPPFRYSMPAAQDAAGTAWRLYAAPEAPVPRGTKAAAAVAAGAGPGARAVGGLAPPHLDGPVHRG